MQCNVSYAKDSGMWTTHDDIYVLQGFGRLMTLVTYTETEAAYLEGLALMLGQQIKIRVNDCDDEQLFCWVRVLNLKE